MLETTFIFEPITGAFPQILWRREISFECFLPFTFLIVDDSKVPFLHCIFVCVMSSRILPTLFSIYVLVTLGFFAFSWKLWTLSSYIHTLELEWDGKVLERRIRRDIKWFYGACRVQWSRDPPLQTWSTLLSCIRQKKEKQTNKKIDAFFPLIIQHLIGKSVFLQVANSSMRPPKMGMMFLTIWGHWKRNQR